MLVQGERLKNSWKSDWRVLPSKWRTQAISFAFESENLTLPGNYLNFKAAGREQRFLKCQKLSKVTFQVIHQAFESPREVFWTSIEILSRWKVTYQGKK